jgi:hypothetical protein
MAYYLGQEVVIALTTEQTSMGLSVVNGTAVLSTKHRNAGPDASTSHFAGPRSKENYTNSPNTDFDQDTTIFGTQQPSDGSGVDWVNELSDVTSVDVGIGVSDEDISYFGQRTTLKTEIKKETTLSVTRKKNNNCWDAIFNAARHGVESDGAYFGYGSVGHVNPGRADYGYRVFLKLKSGGEVLTLPNCCVTGHTISLNADGTSEETMEFMCYVNPIITAGTTGTDDVDDVDTGF